MEPAGPERPGGGNVRSVGLALISSALFCAGCPAVFFDAGASESLVRPGSATPAGNATYSIEFTGLQERHRSYVEGPLHAAIAELGSYQQIGRSDLRPAQFAAEDVHLELRLELEESAPPLLPLLTVLSLGIVPSWTDGQFLSTLRVHGAGGQSDEYRAFEEVRMAMGWIFLPSFVADVSAVAEGRSDAYIGGVFLSLYRSLFAQAREDGSMR